MAIFIELACGPDGAGVARKGAEDWPARRGGDLGSPRKPAGPAFRQPRTTRDSRIPRPNPKTLI